MKKLIQKTNSFVILYNPFQSLNLRLWIAVFVASSCIFLSSCTKESLGTTPDDLLSIHAGSTNSVIVAKPAPADNTAESLKALIAKSKAKSAD